MLEADEVRQPSIAIGVTVDDSKAASFDDKAFRLQQQRVEASKRAAAGRHHAAVSRVGSAEQRKVTALAPAAAAESRLRAAAEASADQTRPLRREEAFQALTSMGFEIK